MHICLFPFFLMHMSCQGLRISQPSRFVLHVITNLLSLLFFFCVWFCLHLFDACNEWIVQLVFLEYCASNLFLLCECLSIIPRVAPYVTLNLKKKNHIQVLVIYFFQTHP
jgi:hypothetical protein